MRTVLKTTFAALAFLALAGEARALPSFGSSAHILKQPLPGASAMRDGSVTPAQYAFGTFCERYPDQCHADGKAPIVALDEDKFAEMQAVNASVNARIAPDPAPRDLNNWSLETSVGNCNEYAIQKRKALIDRGFPVGALSLAVASTPYDRNGIKHLVLVVRTDRGDFVLDNLRERIVAWNRTGYRFLIRQSSLHPRLWVSVSGGAKRARAIHRFVHTEPRQGDRGA